eukprot:scaffold21966_cov36-Cyclotella_meneghiniana.AAC.4
MAAGYATATRLKKARIGWFENDRANMHPLVTEKAHLYHQMRATVCPEELAVLQCEYNKANKAVKDRAEIAQSMWARKRAEEVNKLNVFPKTGLGGGLLNQRRRQRAPH